MPVVEYRLVTDLDMDYNAFKPETYRLPVDGIIYKYNDLDYGKSLGTTGHHPLDMMALKWEDELYNTKLIKIEWNTSRTGLINPVAVFAPVDLGGAITTRATLHNISYIEDLQLGDGDTILVYRANMVIPKVHLSSAAEVSEETAPVVGHIYAVIAKLAKELGIAAGYRVVTNVGALAGQTVHHLHFHVLSGKELGSFN